MYFEALTKAKTKEIASLTNAPHEAEVAKAKKGCRNAKKTDRCVECHEVEGQLGI